MILELFIAIGGAMLEMWFTITGFRELEKIMCEQSKTHHPPAVTTNTLPTSFIEEK